MSTAVVHEGVPSADVSSCGEKDVSRDEAVVSSREEDLSWLVAAVTSAWQRVALQHAAQCKWRYSC